MPVPPAEPSAVIADHGAIQAITLTSPCGVRASVLSLGASLQSLILPDRTGALANVVLGREDPADYARYREFLGVTVGRYANRIAHGRFMLDGVEQVLARGDQPHCLHGGPDGFDRRNWAVVAAGADESRASAVLALHSPDGDQGFPGALDVTVTYALDRHGVLTITFEALASRATVVSLTNHALFNLAGGARSARDHRLAIPAGRFVPIGPGLIPTGELRAVSGGVFDLRDGRVLHPDHAEPQIALANGYDHTFVLDKGLTAEPGLAARLEDPASGRGIEILTTEPGLQVYTGNFLDGPYSPGDGVALEPQKFPDTPNRPEFPSARVDPAHPYRHVMAIRPIVLP
jgi:aldose 1-epimerase